MAETSALKPKWQFLLGLLPSINQAVILLVTALLAAGGTLATQHMTAAKPTAFAEGRPEPVKAVPAPDLSPILAELAELKERVIMIEGYAGLAVDRLLLMGNDFKTPRAVVKKLARPKAVDTSAR
jgi:hypothetical protein